MSKVFPFKAWHIDRACKPTLVEVVKFSPHHACYETDTGRTVKHINLFKTKTEAVLQGHNYLAEMGERIRKMQETRVKRIKALIKSAATEE